MLPDLNTVAYKQAKPTHNTEAAITHLLEYAANNLTKIVKYKASDMILHIDSDA